MSQDVVCHTNCPIRSGRVEVDPGAPDGPAGPAIRGMIPFREPLRGQVQESICDLCWQQWLQMQIKIINELALNLGDPRSHDIIEAHARDFLGLSESPETSTDFSQIGAQPPPGPTDR